MRLKIEKLVYGGAGLARTDEGIIFVPRTAPGDVVEVEITERKKDYSTGRITEILEPSPDRQESTCTAGCCHWQHIRYERQVEYKEAIIRESLGRLGKIDWNDAIQKITGPDRNYRLRATFHIVDGRFGFMQERTNKAVPVQECASLVPELNEFIKTVDPAGATEVHVVSAPAIASTFVLPDGTRKREGRAMITVNGIHYKVDPELFFQANRFLLERFIDEVIAQAGPSPTHLLELYSGIGFFSLPLSRVAQEVISIEAHRTAVRRAGENARLNARWNVKFVQGQIDATLRATDLKPDVVVLNPPRTGCGVRAVRQIAALGARRIVYISCNPSTFAPETAALASSGYALRRITLIDQFPNTFHVEMVGLFELR